MGSETPADQRDSKPDDRGDELKAERRGPGTIFVLLLIGVAAVAGYRLFVAPPAAAPKVEIAPHLVREGRRITIPEGSPLRERLVIEAVTTQEIERSLVLPPVVEPDPPRLLTLPTPLP